MNVDLEGLKKINNGKNFLVGEKNEEDIKIKHYLCTLLGLLNLITIVS